ncbi:Uncharacterised protein [Chlamydia trachomatis]|nr:Uncharacterised protein [Chlamydia trachomatis]
MICTATVITPAIRISQWLLSDFTSLDSSAPTTTPETVAYSLSLEKIITPTVTPIPIIRAIIQLVEIIIFPFIASPAFLNEVIIRSWNIAPYAIGRVIYGALSPNPKLMASILLSTFILFIRPSSGGINIGINAMCIGIKVSATTANNITIIANINLFPLINLPICLAITSAAPLLLIQ